MNVELDTSEIARMLGNLQRLELVMRRPREILKGVGSRAEAQTRDRILYQKTSPDGVGWKAWSTDYARTRTAGDSLLVDTHALERTLGHDITSTTEVQVFSPLPYAAAQNFGYAARGLPARPFLGLSTDNASDLERWIGGSFDSILTSGEVNT